MNQYGRLAWEHWQTWRPRQLGQIQDPEVFFAQLGNEVADQIHATAQAIAGEDPAGETYLGKLSRLNHARFTAEETVLREMVLLPPEPGHPQADTQAETPVEDDPETLDEEQKQWPRQAPWLPLVMDPDHPNYRDTDDDPGLRRISSPSPDPSTSRPATSRPAISRPAISSQVTSSPPTEGRTGPPRSADPEAGPAT